MATLAAALLIATAVWSFIVWPAFFRRVLRDPRSRTSDGKATKFLTVHAVLVGISLLLALAGVVVGILLLLDR
jgi:hypothetical protein